MSLFDSVSKKWLTLSERFNNLVKRERVLISLCVLAAIYMGWEFGVAASLDKKRTVLTKRFEAANRDLTKITAEEKVLVKIMANDPSTVKRREILRLKKTLEKTELDLQKLSVGLLPAEKLSQLLQDVLRESSALQLRALHTHLPEKVTLNTGVENTSEDDGSVANDSPEGDQPVVEDAGVYKHAVTVSLTGSYFDIVTYLKSLEDLNWTLYWQYIDYTVDGYPNATVTLQVYTLSTEKGAFSA